MKKLLSILLCAALVLGLAACGTAAEEPSDAPASDAVSYTHLLCTNAHGFGYPKPTRERTYPSCNMDFTMPKPLRVLY